jgi:hypothetical protein
VSTPFWFEIAIVFGQVHKSIDDSIVDPDSVLQAAQISVPLVVSVQLVQLLV